MAIERKFMGHAKPGVAEINEGELIIRLIEASTGTKRPEGKTLEGCLDDIDQASFSTFKRMAQVATAYFIECVQNTKTIN